MFDRSAAITSARAVLDAAPTIEGAGGSELAVDLGKLVDAVVAAGNPDALVIPVYDGNLAGSARYRLEQDTEEGGLGARMTVTAHPGAVAVRVFRQGSRLVAGLIAGDAAWHAGLALCSAAMEAQRVKEAEGDRNND